MQLTESRTYNAGGGGGGGHSSAGGGDGGSAGEGKKGISVRFPRFLRVRPDKTPAHSTTTDQLSEMMGRVA